MFLLVASALAGTQNNGLLGWPCQRLNWAWRNVWSTCSIHSFAPLSGAGVETPTTIASGFRFYTGTATPVNTLNAGGWYQPSGTAAIPAFFCTNAAMTGSGATNALRNRCRRAVDAYGSLVRQCQAQGTLAGNRGPVQNNNWLGPDWAPAAGHQPHVSNVQGLTAASQFCTLPTGTTATPAALSTPANTCPGLLGWFTVVYNACGFTNVPALSPNGQSFAPNAAAIHTYFPYGGTATTLVTGATAAPWSVGFFCKNAATAPDAWNPVGATFRTSRCRKALDQFGRTAQRCHASVAPLAAGPSQAGGYNDPLRVLAVGHTNNAQPIAPIGINAWAPLCN